MAAWAALGGFGILCAFGLFGIWLLLSRYEGLQAESYITLRLSFRIGITVGIILWAILAGIIFLSKMFHPEYAWTPILEMMFGHSIAAVAPFTLLVWGCAYLVLRRHFSRKRASGAE